jgi:hypothetical protein
VHVMGKPSITQILILPDECDKAKLLLELGRDVDTYCGIHSLESATSRGPKSSMECVSELTSKPLVSECSAHSLCTTPESQYRNHHGAFRALQIQEYTVETRG